MSAFEDYGTKEAGRNAKADATPDKSGRMLAIFAAGVACLIGIAVIIGVSTGVEPDPNDVGVVTTD
ncbi:hypothetical protein [Pontivivens insulae]|uniref:Uncharacterized protein n=1 Tax=Pontivivens insulae TaxID=1639689 RepID=A0A2R8A9T9_9RHOB|nr:hypothetical protein [Pontivivens insulae]RED12804.1 hypothetical protein DFR53_1934 [Pontivivens insulae]SPF28895.1 hypothetical protein POI8812_01198 [Pontivivens insulae]